MTTDPQAIGEILGDALAHLLRGISDDQRKTSENHPHPPITREKSK